MSHKNRNTRQVLFAKPPNRCEVINDLDGELITYWRTLRHHPHEFIRCWRSMVISRDLFEAEKRKDHQRSRIYSGL